MGHRSLAQELGDWLIDQALDNPDIIQLFEEACNRLRAIGIPISRARLAASILHPMFQMETVLWRMDEPVEFEQFLHQAQLSEAWQASPMYFMLKNGLSEFRRNLAGPNKLIDFPVLQELVEEGMTDYLVIGTSLDGPSAMQGEDPKGIFVTWSSDREGGFSDDDIDTLSRIQRRLATAIKSSVQRRITSNITETYLGRQAGAKVLDGAIKLGDGQDTLAVVWYADMRASTALADQLPPAEFLELLNVYFSCLAGPTIECGGEVLEFIGDGVLAIFPYDDDAGKVQAVRCATMALERSLHLSDETNAERELNGCVTFDFGVGINTGRVMFGNIGVASRLSFSAIGPTVNEAERIENQTKNFPTRALVTKDIAEVSPEIWTSIGLHPLPGVSGKRELFSLKVD